MKRRIDKTAILPVRPSLFSFLEPESPGHGDDGLFQTPLIIIAALPVTVTRNQRVARCQFLAHSPSSSPVLVAGFSQAPSPSLPATKPGRDSHSPSFRIGEAVQGTRAGMPEIECTCPERVDVIREQRDPRYRNRLAFHVSPYSHVHWQKLRDPLGELVRSAIRSAGKDRAVERGDRVGGHAHPIFGSAGPLDYSFDRSDLAHQVVDLAPGFNPFPRPHAVPIRRATFASGMPAACAVEAADTPASYAARR